MSRLNSLNQVWKERAEEGIMLFPRIALVGLYGLHLSDAFPFLNNVQRRTVARSFEKLPEIMAKLCLD